MSAQGMSVQPLTFARVASLRYFQSGGSFTDAVAGVIGGPLPTPGQARGYAVAASAEHLVLTCCRPTETLALCAGLEQFDALAQVVAGRNDGCLVDLSSGLWSVVVRGERRADLIVRLGSPDSIPAVGEARVGRLAEVAVTSLCVTAGELVLLAERVYSDHISGWIRETLRDMEG
jgi:hypothetical protein